MAGDRERYDEIKRRMAELDREMDESTSLEKIGELADQHEQAEKELYELLSEMAGEDEENEDDTAGTGE